MEYITNLLENVFSNGYKIASILLGLIALYYVFILAAQAIKEFKDENWKKGATKALFAIVIVIIAFVGIRAAFTAGKSISDENELNGITKPSINDFVQE